MIDIVLFILKIAIVALLYLFIWWLMRSVMATTRAPVASAAGFAPAVPAVDFAPQAAPLLVVEESPVLAPGALFYLDGWTTVGRGSDNAIVLDERYVSSAHARVILRGQQYVVEDLGSSNGTVVDGERIAEAPLRRGSRVRIGETVFRYEE